MLSLPLRPMMASACRPRTAAINPFVVPVSIQPTPSPAFRSFSTTIPQLAKTVKSHRFPTDLIPPYPYGERLVYKQSNRGLYGSARIRFGHNVAPKHNVKTRRFWRPNVQVKRFLLPSLGAYVKTRLTLRVLKTIDKEGGLENYLLKSKPARIKDMGPGGWNMRWLLMQSRPVQEKFNEERVALGLEPKEVEDKDHIINYVLDYATPGPLSTKSREFAKEREAGLKAEWDEIITPRYGEVIIGEEDLIKEEVIGEAEQERIMAEADAEDQAMAQKLQKRLLQQKPPESVNLS